MNLKLYLRFGETHSLQNYYFQFTNRKQKFEENITSLDSDIKRLSQLAYLECSQVIRDKITCAQFISALSDGFMSRTLQLKGIASLRIVIKRTKTIKLIQDSSFEQRKKNVSVKGRGENKNNNNFNNNFNEEVRDCNKEKKNIKEKERKFNKNKFEFNKNKLLGIKIMKERELEVERNGSAGKKVISGVSEQAGKQRIIELCGVSSTGIEKSPQYVYFVNCSCHVTNICYCDVFVTNKFFFRNNKIENNLKDFCYVGQLDNKNCVFKIDTRSDVSIVNKSLIAPNKIKYKLSNYNLRYLTEKKVVTNDKIFVKV